MLKHDYIILRLIMISNDDIIIKHILNINHNYKINQQYLIHKFINAL